MKTADKVAETVVEATEMAVDTVAEKTGLPTTKTIIIAAGVTLLTVGVVYGIKKFRSREVAETE